MDGWTAGKTNGFSSQPQSCPQYDWHLSTVICETDAEWDQITWWKRDEQKKFFFKKSVLNEWKGSDSLIGPGVPVVFPLKWRRSPLSPFCFPASGEHDSCPRQPVSGSGLRRQRDEVGHGVGEGKAVASSRGKRGKRGGFPSVVGPPPSSACVSVASSQGTVIRVFSIPEGQKLFEFRRGVKR